MTRKKDTNRPNKKGKSNNSNKKDTSDKDTSSSNDNTSTTESSHAQKRKKVDKQAESSVSDESSARESDPTPNKTSLVIDGDAANGDGDDDSSEGGDHSIFGDDDYNSGMYHGLRGRRYCLSTLRFFGLFLFLWLSQFLVTSSMKHMGILDFDDTVSGFDFDPTSMFSKTVLPQLQELQENFGSIKQLQQKFDSIYNETLAKTYTTKQSQRPGYLLAEEGAAANYPVVMIPGFVTSGLEVWQSRECAKKYFRQKIWSGMESARALLTDSVCWREHIALDPHTGMDPDGISLRAAQGFQAADYFIANYWVWEKLLENLSDLGYSPSTMTIESYDWRLSFPLLEERDGFLTKLKYKIEAMHKASGKKVVMTSHSMGAQMVHFFFKWVTTPEKEGGGGGGKNWVDEHVHAFVNIAGSHLGVPKAASALLSGEMNDLLIMGPIGQMLEQFFGRKLRKDLFNTWGSLWAMLPKGGDRIWDTGADMCLGKYDAEDPICKFLGNSSKNDNPENHVPLVLVKGNEESVHTEDSVNEEEHRDVAQNETIASLRSSDGSLNATVSAFAEKKNHTTESTFQFLRSWGAGTGPDLSSAKLYSNYGDIKSKQRNKAKVEWLDPTLTPLPHAPNMKIYCMYGYGLDTERAYMYKVNNNEASPAASGNDSVTKQTPGPNVELPFVVDTEYSDPDYHFQHGMRFVEGDGSVPLLSLGYICNDAWQRKDSGLNPSGTKVYTREYKHQKEFTTDDPFRGGPKSADHVDILGNVAMTEDFLRVVSDFHPRNEDKIESSLREINKAVNEHSKGGLFKKDRRLIR